MEEQKLEGLRVAILAADGFEQAELEEPRQALAAAGAVTAIIAPAAGEIRGVHGDRPGDSIQVDQTFDQADPNQFDAVLLPGGARGAAKLRSDRQAQDFLRQMDAAGNPVAAICHGPWLLVSAGLVDGRSLAAAPDIQEDIQDAGGTWMDQEVVTDRNWVSSRGLEDLPAFTRAVLQHFPKVIVSGPPVDDD
jgi:protease I